MRGYNPAVTGESTPLEEGRAVPDEEGWSVAGSEPPMTGAEGPTISDPETPPIAPPEPPPLDADTDAPPLDADTDAPPPDADAPPLDADADAPPPDADAPPPVADATLTVASTTHPVASDRPTFADSGPTLADARPTVAALDARAAADPICPYLGMVGDRNGHHSFPSRLHLCHAGEPAHIGLGFQADYCLGGAYPSCARYQRAEEAAAAEAAATGGVRTARAADGSVAAAALGPVPAASGRLGRVRSPGERGRRSSRLVSVLLGLALISTLVAFGIAAGFIRLPSGVPIAAVTPTPTATVSPTSTPTDTPSATPSPTSTPTTVPTPSASAATGEVLHVVQAGETLTSIALLYNVSVADIVARNGITDPNSIVVGQTLVIPLGGASPSVAPTPTAPASGPPTITPKPTKTPTPTSFVYVVQAGDTLSAIATKFNVTVQAILDANPDITDPNVIFVGQKIIIPAP
jgi:LysM repeat protein